MARSLSYSKSRAASASEVTGKLFLAILFVASVVLIAFSRTEASSTTQARQHAAGWLAPIGEFIAAPIETTAQSVANFQQFIANTHRATALAEENEALRSWKLRAEQLAAENASLRQLLRVAASDDPAHRAVKVLGSNSGPYHQQLQLDAGQRQGLLTGMAAVNQQGLVGRVLSVQDDSAQLMRVSDINSRVAVITGKSRERAMIRGLGESALGLYYLPEDTKIQLGEKLYTSGDGGLLPANILVGVVSTIQDDRVMVTPAVDPARLEFVRLLAPQS